MLNSTFLHYQVSSLCHKLKKTVGQTDKDYQGDSINGSFMCKVASRLSMIWTLLCLSYEKTLPRMSVFDCILSNYIS